MSIQLIQVPYDRENFHIQAATIAACDPDSDRQGRAITAGLTFAKAMVPEKG